MSWPRMLLSFHELVNAGNGAKTAHFQRPMLSFPKDPGRSSNVPGPTPGDCAANPLAIPPTISTANLHSRYLTNSKGQTLIISACSPLIVGVSHDWTE